MDTVAAARLARHINNQRAPLCEQVSLRLLTAFPEIATMLRLEENYEPQARLTEVSVGRFSELVRAMLIFGLPSLADQELRWASGVLPRSGVTYQHQSSMVRWFFEELRKLDLTPGEVAVSRDLEQYLLGLVRQCYAAQN